MQIPVEGHEQYWNNNNRHSVCASLNGKWGTVNGQVKTEFLCELLVCVHLECEMTFLTQQLFPPLFVLPALFRKKELPGKDVLLCPRKDLAIFKIFCDSFLSCTHGKIDFKDRARTAVVSMVTTLCSEAYTLVYLENSYDTWYAEASEDETIPARMYTQNP